MEIKIKGIAVAAFIYMYSAMAVFFAGWLRPAWAIGICVVLGMKRNYLQKGWNNSGLKKMFPPGK